MIRIIKATTMTPSAAFPNVAQPASTKIKNIVIRGNDKNHKSPL